MESLAKLLPVLSLCVLLCGEASAQVVPSGFTTETVVSGTSGAVALAFVPDGRLMWCEQTTGNIKIATLGSPVASATVGTITNINYTGNERGLLGLVVDPGFATNGYIYAYYNSSLSANLRLTRFQCTGALANPASTAVTFNVATAYHILTDFPDNAYNHNGASLRFGPDGMLYMSPGDDATSCNAQNNDILAGKILRLNLANLPAGAGGPPAKSTLIPTGNPITTGTDNAKLMWAKGLRNPFRFHIDSVTNKMLIADVGQNAWEEVSVGDVGTGGGHNFGWPFLEGNAAYSTCTGASSTGAVAPIVAVNHSAGWYSIMSMGVYRNPPGGTFNFGPAYEGMYFYADYYSGAVRIAAWNGTTWAPAPAVAGQPNANDWGTGFANTADALVGPDGALYYANQTSGIRRIKSNANAPVLSVASGNGQFGVAGRPLTNPMTVRLATASGNPIAGTTVTFAVTSGGGTLNPTTATTDASGFASTTLTLSETSNTNPVVTASSTGATSVTLGATWRGLNVTYLPTINYVSLVFKHSQLNAPFTICAETPTPNPWITTTWGDIWTSVLTPQPGLIAFDGLGLVGPPNAFYKTGAVNPTFTQAFTGLPVTGGLTLRFQAYAVDSALWPAVESVVLSNKVDRTFN